MSGKTENYVIDTLTIVSPVKPRGSETTVLKTEGYIAITRKIGEDGKPTGLVQLDTSANGSPVLFSVSKWAACFKHAKEVFANASIDREMVERAIDADTEEQLAAIREKAAERKRELAGENG